MVEKIFFKDSKGNRIVGSLSNPSKNTENPIIIICHGFNSKKETIKCVEIEKELIKKNISTLRFDFFGHGESDGKFEDLTISKAVDDVLKAIEFLKEKGYKKIGLVGDSFGGISSINAAAKTNDLYVLGLISPVSNYVDKILAQPEWYDHDTWKKQGYTYYKNEIYGNTIRLNYGFFEDAKNNNGYEAAKKIKIPTLIVHGDEDKSVPVEQSKKTASLIENCRLEIIKGCDHYYTKPEDPDKLTTLITNFIVENS